VNKARLVEQIAALVNEKGWKASPTFATSPTATACAS
jgi:hypothetical protein